MDYQRKAAPQPAISYLNQLTELRIPIDDIQHVHGPILYRDGKILVFPRNFWLIIQRLNAAGACIFQEFLQHVIHSTSLGMTKHFLKVLLHAAKNLALSSGLGMNSSQKRFSTKSTMRGGEATTSEHICRYSCYRYVYERTTIVDHRNSEARPDFW